MEDEFGVFGHADAFAVVGVDAVGGDIPRCVALLAGVELHVGELVAVFAFDFGFFADGLQTAAVTLGFDFDVLRRAAAFGQVVLQFVAAHGRALVVEDKAFACFDGVFGLVVNDALGVEHLRVAFDDNAAARFDADARLAAHVVGGDAGVVGGQCFFAAAPYGVFGLGGRLNRFAVFALRAGAAQCGRCGGGAARSGGHAHGDRQRFD